MAHILWMQLQKLITRTPPIAVEYCRAVKCVNVGKGKRNGREDNDVELIDITLSKHVIVHL